MAPILRRGSRLECLVIIPARNEEESITQVIYELLELGIPRERLVVVDSHSTDDTADVARSLGVRVVKQWLGRGKAGAIMSAIKSFKASCYIVIDADGEHPAELVPKIEGMLSDYDLVRTERSDFGRGPLFSFGNKVLTAFINLLFGTSTKDALSGLMGFRRDVASEQPPLGDCWEVMIVWKSKRVRAATIEYVPKARLAGKKKVSVLSGIKIALCAIYYKLRE
ncbi:MAG: glycosyltransferase family 2 protein [Crenarchaeota archaeon]|nr:glycosyltransferase family 2 protein [Thermoproteota archaeon]